MVMTPPMTAPLVNLTPFGSPVVPLVYMIVQRSSLLLGGSLKPVFP